MIRLKARQEEKKKEEAAEAAEAARDAALSGSPGSNNVESDGKGQVKILGIGRGKRTTKPKEKKRTPGEIRIQKGINSIPLHFQFLRYMQSMLIWCPDIAELDGGSAAVVSFPDPNDLTTFNVRVTVDTGLWLGASYDFTFKIPAVGIIYLFPDIRQLHIILCERYVLLLCQCYMCT
jgi:ubiquitin-conjugating enzyme E2 M